MLEAMDEMEQLTATASRQHGTFSRSQAHAAGFTDSQLRRRVDSGALVQIGPNAFRGALVPVTPMVELVGLVTDVGQPVVVSGPTAAALHGLDGFALRRPFHLTVDRSRQLRRRNAVIHSSATAFDNLDLATVHGLRVTSAARTLVDLARTESLARLTGALDAALRDGLLSENLLHRRVAALRGRGRYGVPTLLAAIEGRDIRRGAHSWLERRYLELVHEAGLPRPHTQQVLGRAGDRLVRVDVRFPDTNVVVELLGYRFHRSNAEMQRDAERMNALVLAGLRPLQFAYERVVDDPSGVIDQTRAALGSLAA